MTFRPSKTLACAVAAATLASALPAEAGERWRDHHRRPIAAERHGDAADLIAAGLIGLAAGAIIAGIASRPPPAPREPAWRHPQAYPRPSPDRVYFPPVPPRGMSTGAAGLYQPWSPAWYAWCGERYRSFDARAGTFIGYDGVRRFCIAG
ncbi:MAG: BA14K family protein [Aquamicrobium sp.]|uniref:BA14K family protein n=1 Tax=Aquamicrobium sp. TaxID=1872579 RepID=UPI00349E7CF2|nr:BA14K family protein [Aquamicrobium sp.]